MKGMLERCALAAMDDVKRQLAGQPIPGVPDVANSWTATGAQSINMEEVARAVLTALRTPTPEMVKAMHRENETSSGKLFSELTADMFTAAIDSIIEEAGE